MYGITPLTPAYGREYKSKAAVQADIDADRDFLTSDGKPINKEQLARLGLKKVEVRYAQLRKCAVVVIA